MRSFAFLAVLALGLAGSELYLVSQQAPEIGLTEPTLAMVRAATDRFRDVDVALAEGYIREPLNLCDTAEMMGQPAEYGVMGSTSSAPSCSGLPVRPTHA